MEIQNKVQLITYPDSLGGNLQTLNDVLLKYFADIFEGGIHILPPFPSSGDRGFAPLTYFEIEPEFGDWEDIREISKNFDIMVDLMVNHISKQSIYFQDFLKYGRKSKYADMFITIDKIWPDNNPSKEEIEKIFLRRTEPFSEYKIEATGEIEKVWTSFGKTVPSEQIDIDVKSQTTRKLLVEFLTNFSENNIKMIRLDAVGYVIKKRGTSCFFIEPEIYRFLNWFKEQARLLNIEILPEVHAHYSTQFKLSEHGNWIYDFILPYAVLEAIITKNSSRLYKYLKIRPEKQFTMLDCHDGVPVIPDLNDLVEPQELKKVVDVCLERGANLSRIFSPKFKSKDGFDVHQIRGAFYSLLNCDDDAYIAARAIQFFTPGIPQVYYVGLLAGKNDSVNKNGVIDGREINRHNFSVNEIDSAVKKPVVQRLLKLIRFRNEYPAFNGKFKVTSTGINNIELKWEKGKNLCVLTIDFSSNKSIINYKGDSKMVEEVL
ncbi:MAG: sucrose phosphorylase [Chlorobi bacterium]|nr:sucrose phosphorylase [Chlorobiota bacterium]